MGSTLIVTAPAKVNLHLVVGAVRDDGYHDVTTVLHALALHDTVTLTGGVPFSFACEPDIGLRPEENLAARAARSMAARFGRDLDVAIAIEKRIPAGGGLGGASADAAAVLTGMAALWGIDAQAHELVEVARSLGADVPFFLGGGAALMTGRGDVLEHRFGALDAPVVLVKPEEPVPTAAAYAAFDRLASLDPSAGRLRTDVSFALRSALDAGDVREAAGALVNTMTPASVSLVPAIGDALALVSGAPGVLGAEMAGSGSTVFGICADDETATRVADLARVAGYWTAVTRLSAAGCTVSAV